MGTSDYGGGTNCLRITFVICNVFGLVLSILGFGIGIWGVVTADSETDVITGNDAIASAAIFLVASIVGFFLCAAGIVGAIFMLRPFLIVYAIILGIIVILEFISAILAFVLSDTARDFLEDNMEEAISDYRVFENETDYDNNVNRAVELLQDNLKCCGVNNYTDWVTFNPVAVSDNEKFPPGDCECDGGDDDNCVVFTINGTVTSSPPRYVWEDGCLDILETNARIYFIASGVIALIIMFIEIAFVAVAIGLIICITKNRGKDSVV